MSKTIQVVRAGVVMTEVSDLDYTLNVMNGMVTLLDKNSLKIAYVFSPSYYDYIGVTEDEIDA